MDVENIIKKELSAGEIVLWSGRPNLDKRFAMFDYFLIPFSIFWIWLVIAFTITMILLRNFAVLIALLPLLFIGGYLSLGRFAYKKAKKEKFVYAITNKRIICAVMRKNGSIDFTTEEFAKISDEKLQVAKDGTGTILFGSVGFVSTAFYNTGLDFFNSNATAFFDVDDVQKVFDIYKSAKFTANLMK